MTAAAEPAEILLSCAELDDTLRFFRETLGFRIDSVFPADAPRLVQLSGYGLRLRLERDGRRDATRLRLPAEAMAGAAEHVAPNGTQILKQPAANGLEVPQPVPSLVVTRAGDGAGWHTGRAGMQYRDLVPDRQGGHIIASHIRIPGSGPVPDYVHFHRIRLQLIYCRRGWVQVAYEDQGPPFVLEAGDCVLQPPGIRHRVLESGDLEVVEVGCPAEHITCVDHDLALPTATVHADRDFGGQRFVRHQAAAAAWAPWRLAGFDARDTGIAAASAGVGGARVARLTGAAETRFARHDAPSLFLFVLNGGATLELEGGRREELAGDDSVMLPPGLGYRFTGCTPDLELLEVTMPGDIATSFD